MARIGILLLILAFSGCISAPAAVSPASGAGSAVLAADGMPLAALGLAGSGCFWGGGHSIHSHQLDDIVPAPWKVADVVEDIGVQPTYSDPGEQIYGVADSGWGNWHTNFVCDAWTLDGKPTPLTFGMVLTRVEPPPFDPAPVHRNYIVNVIASDSDELNMRLMMDGWMSMRTSGQASWSNGIFHHVLATQMHGTYESMFQTRGVGSLNDTTIRFWFQKENPSPPGGQPTFSPVSFDLRISGGYPPVHAIADPEGYFSHTNTDDHALVAGQPSGVVGQIAGAVFGGFDASFAWGPAPNVSLDKAYSHL